MNRLGLFRLEWLLLIASIINLVLIPFTSPYYIGLFLSSFLIFLSLSLHPKIEREIYQPEPIIVIEPEKKDKEDKEDNFVERVYEWSFPIDIGGEKINFKKEFLKILISMKEFKEKREKNPTKEKDFGLDFGLGVLKELVENGITREVKEVATHIRDTTLRENLCDYLEIINAISFVQEAIKYVSDEESTGLEDYWKYPIETLYDKGGDCECKSILAVSILKILGKDVIFIFISWPGSSHMAVGISGADNFPEGFNFIPYRGRKYFYCEVTAKGWLPGQIPPEFNFEKVEIIPI